jgi:hypothetical protein
VSALGRVGVGKDVSASFFRLNPHGRHSAPDRTQPCSSRAEAPVFTKPFQPSTPISLLLCDLRDLCAIISPLAWFSRGSHGVHQDFSTINSNFPPL